MIIEGSYYRCLLCCLLVFTLSGCAVGTLAPQPVVLESLTHVTLLQQEAAGQGGDPSETLQLVEDGIKNLSGAHYNEASDKFSQALKLDTANSGLHFFNALTYHLRALNGDSSLFELAEQGYQLAIKFDSSNWIARYHLGLLALDQKKFSAAQRSLAEVLLFNNRHPDTLYNMIVASYYAQDPHTAAGVLEQLRELEPDSERVLSASCMIRSALGDHQGAQQSLARYRKLYVSSTGPIYLKERIDDWQRFYEYADMGDASVGTNQPQFIRAAYSPSWQDEEDGYDSDRESNNERNGSADDNKMIIVDVVIVRTEENITTRKGVNLLSGLTIQFGDGDNPGFSYSNERIKGAVDLPYDQTSTITRALNIPAIKYSLNIFNSHTDRAEILARPTLIALDGEESTFFSGLDISAVTVGSSGSYGGGSPVQIDKKVGVNLKITPTFQDNEAVKLNVYINRTFLRTPSEDIIFENKIETSETEVSASVIMNYGETLVLSGLSEKETERIKDGVPFLQSLPILQYFFSQKNTRDFQRSVLVLLTPRPPQYVYRETGHQHGASSNPEGFSSLDELQARYSDWFKPYPNWASVFHHLQSNSLYREFRTGDVTMEKWPNQQSLLERLKRTLGFLYY